MSAIKDIYYDVETLFIEGYSANQIASELTIPIEYVNSVLSDFGIDPDDFEDVADTQHGDYYGA